MRATTTLLCLTLAGCSSSCAGPSKPTINWPRVVACTEPAQVDLLRAVSAILVAPEDGDSTTIGDRAVAELTDMAARHGENVVACLVDEAVRSFEHVPGTPPVTPPSVSADVPAEPPAITRKSLPTAPSPAVSEPAQALPERDATALQAAARGRDFLTRVAGTQVQGEGEL